MRDTAATFAMCRMLVANWCVDVVYRLAVPASLTDLDQKIKGKAVLVHYVCISETGSRCDGTRIPTNPRLLCIYRL